jgi:hypothetical protein
MTLPLKTLPVLAALAAWPALGAPAASAPPSQGPASSSAPAARSPAVPQGCRGNNG